MATQLPNSPSERKKFVLRLAKAKSGSAVAYATGDDKRVVFVEVQKPTKVK